MEGMAMLPGEPLPPKKERGDLDDKQKVARKEREGVIRERQDKEDVAWVVSTIQGRRFFWRTLEHCGVFRSSMTGNNTTFFNEGKRDVGLKMLADLMASNPDAYLLMAKESQKEL